MRTRSIFTMMLLGAMGTSRAVHAQSAKAPNQSTTATSTIKMPDVLTARERSADKADAALELFEQEKWDKAFDVFLEAETILHGTVFVLYMARCQQKMGKLVAASKLYTQVITEVGPKSATEPTVQARADAKRELAELMPRIPTLYILLEGEAGRTFRVTINGLQVSSTVYPILLDPGKYEVDVYLDDGQRVIKTVELPEYKQKMAPIVLPAPKKPGFAVQSNVSLIPCAVLCTLGAMAFVGGIGLQQYGEKKLADGSASCTGANCERYEIARGEADTLSSVSAGLLVGGSVTLLTGAVWAGLTSDSAREKKPKKAFVMPMVTPNGVFLTGTL